MSKPAPIESFIQKTVASLGDGSFVRLALSSPTQADLPLKVLGRAVKLRGTLHLSLTLRHPTRDVTQNLSPAEVPAWLHQQLGPSFRSALLGTTSRDWQFISNETGEARLVDHKPAKKSAPVLEHDQKTTGFLDASARDWLTGLGVLDRDGKLRASMADKHRQINHYLEIVSHLAKECGWTGAPRTASACSGETLTEPNRSSALHLVDMGCAKVISPLACGICSHGSGDNQCASPASNRVPIWSARLTRSPGKFTQRDWNLFAVKSPQ